MDEAQQKQFFWTEGTLEALKPGPLMDAVRFWQDRCGDKFAPSWNVDVLLEIPVTLAPMSNVVDTGDGEPPFTFRFFGTGLVDLHAFELTGKTTDAISPQHFKETCVTQHLITIRRKQPCVFLNEVLTPAGNTYTHTMVRLPFTGDGMTVSQILTAEEHNADAEEVKKVFAVCRPEPVPKRAGC